MLTFTILLPCYNPHAEWEENVYRNFLSIQQHNPDKDFNLVIVNDGSTKGFSENKLSRLNIKKLLVIELTENKGKGFALREGVHQSVKTDYYIYTDVDFPYTELSFQKIISELEKGETNIAAGVRDEGYYKGVPLLRKLISKSLRGLIGSLFHLKITDTQCGLKGFDNKGREIFLQTTINRYLFDMEFIFLASAQSGISMKPVPVELRDNIQFSKLNLKILFREGQNFLKIFFHSFTENRSNQ